MKKTKHKKEYEDIHYDKENIVTKNLKNCRETIGVIFNCNAINRREFIKRT